MVSIVELFERFGDVEWYAIRPGELTSPSASLPAYPPVLTWRYTRSTKEHAAAFAAIVSAYEGAVRWSVTFESGKNICLLPSKIIELKEQGIAETTVQAIRFLQDQDETFIRDAQKDFRLLLCHIESHTSQDS